MNPIIESLTGMNVLTDEIIAMDFLNTAKSGVRNYAMAVTECVTPEVKAVLANQLEQAIDTHERIVDYLIGKGLYQPHNLTAQIQLDLKNMETALNLPS
ncbi:spore coat protein [Paenibacillus sp. SAF-054]|uniref:spore coat protein n=1 Tax=unclassified Paenibacillus TaxID=185978 RepID=UPI003F7D5B4A